MAKTKKYYAVQAGRTPGVYETWAECESQVKGFPGAKFKSFSSRCAAEDAVRNGWGETQSKNLKRKDPSGSQESDALASDYIQDSISVDAACSGNPGAMEYQCVDTKTGEQIFKSNVYPVGTNNIGEFLAIVDALRYLKQKGDSTTPIYSDSVSALAWVRNERVKTNLDMNAKTIDLLRDVDDAVNWLRANPYENPVLKWDTKSWGESKADFGRK